MMEQEQERARNELIWRIAVDGISRRKDAKMVQSSHPRVLVP
jgi:hypothetical protein